MKRGDNNRVGARRRVALVGLLPLLTLSGCASFAPASDLEHFRYGGSLESSPAEVVLEAGYSAESGLNYLFTHPGTGSRPLIVFLHSLEERGDLLAPLLKNDSGQGIGLTQIALEAEADHPLTDYATLSPLCPEGTFWYLLHDNLLTLIEEIASRPEVNGNRIILTGVSMGGMGVWSLGMRAPERFTALVPISGAVYSPPMRRRFAELAGTPMWVFHDRNDPSIGLERESWAVQRVRDAGGRVRFTITETGRHYIHQSIYRDPALYAWLDTLPDH